MQLFLGIEILRNTIVEPYRLQNDNELAISRFLLSHGRIMAFKSEVGDFLIVSTAIETAHVPIK